MRDITEQVQAQQLLEQRVEERTRELSTLLEVSHNVASTLELKSLLGLILEQLKVVADYTGSSIFIVENDDLVIFENRGPYPVEQVLHLHFPVKRFGVIWEMHCRREAVVIDDVRDDSPLAQTLREAVGDILNTTFRHVRTWMGIPLMLKEQIIGLLVLTSREPHYFTSRHAALALGIANQAAIAIGNARLYTQAQALAALEERQKLARELHDSVSQALYGISLGTHAARTALERDPEHVAEPLDYVLSLAEAGLAEMRALIFELRPESLETEGLVSALSKQAAALQARHEILVSSELCDEPDVSLRVKQELYRIAQEAMHNTVKHAHASHVALRLDWTASFPGHLGLHSMRERVSNLGGTFEIDSTPSAGTRVCVSIPGRA
jgi:signal transduction histidine kinase